MQKAWNRWIASPPAQILLWIALPLAAGLLLSLAIPQPVIGTLFLRDAIYSTSAQNVIDQLEYARLHPEVRAVVLVLDSPGGTVADTESLYLELIRVRKDKPVVAYKFTGGSRDSFLRSLEPIKNSFYEAVVLGRGDALNATEDQIVSGELYLGTEAVRLGLADAIGTQIDGIESAAALAHVSNYESKDLRKLAGLPETTDGLFFMELENGMRSAYPREAGLYLLYIPPSDRRQP
jgi:ClpP class serine protease